MTGLDLRGAFNRVPPQRSFFTDEESDFLVNYDLKYRLDLPAERVVTLFFDRKTKGKL